MRTRALVVVTLALAIPAVLAGCGGHTAAPSPAPASASASAAKAAPDPLKAQREGARKLLAKLEAEGGCSCTAAIRARDRLERGIAKKRPDGVVLSGS